MGETRAMLTLDGSVGEGGGQILRTALALSVVTQTPFRIKKIRAARAKPGLLRQHLTAVLAAAKICGAETQGAHLNSGELWFTPGQVQPGDYSFSIGSAGSTTLVLQTILPPLILAAGPATIHLEGGTHNTHAPPFDFLAKAFAPLLNQMGPQVTLSLERYGFYPAGGGRMSAAIKPAAALEPLHLTERQPIRQRLAIATVAGLSRDIGDRELAVVAQQLAWPAEALQLRHLPTGHGQGNVLTLEVSDGRVAEVCTGFGRRGVRAEAVAAEAVRAMREYLDSQAPVGVHLADQLLLPLCLAGEGSFLTRPLSPHTETNIETIRKFLDLEITAKPYGDADFLVAINRRP